MVVMALVTTFATSPLLSLLAGTSGANEAHPMPR
jgi:hypothetical protein